MMTFSEAEKIVVDQLKPVYDADEAKGLAFLIIQYLTGISRANLLLNKSQAIEQNEQMRLISIIKELKTGKPWQYILGETEFYGLKFRVNPSVLIPRPETEELADWILSEARGQNQDPRLKTQDLKILDIGTGSGCIAIALKKHLPHSEVYGMDISATALETAHQNAILNDIHVEFIEHDILSEILHDRKYSIIVSNPPYITIGEKQNMHINVLEHEPHTALFVPDENPLVFYERIVKFSKNNLVPEGLLFFEINESFGREILSLLENEGFYHVELKRDMQGKERMIKAQYQV